MSFDESGAFCACIRGGCCWLGRSAAAGGHLAIDDDDETGDRQQRPCRYRPVELLVEEDDALECGDDGGHGEDGVGPEDAEVLDADEIQESSAREVDDADHGEPSERAEGYAEESVRVEHGGDARNEHPARDEREEIACARRYVHQSNARKHRAGAEA